jgi:hypothetical protein
MKRAMQATKRLAIMTTRLVAAFVLAALTDCAAGADVAAPISFERDVWPTIAANCLACHGARRR